MTYPQFSNPSLETPRQPRGRLLALALALDRRAWLWLVLGTLLLALSQTRFGVGALGFLAPVPLLRYLRLTRGWRSVLAFCLAALLSWHLVFLKIVTDPVPLAFAPVFGIPLALFHGLPYFGWRALHRRLGDGWLSCFAFAALMLLGEFVQRRFTPFASWGAAAYTQIDNLPLLQVASVGGIEAVSALLYLVAAALESLLAQASLPKTERWGLRAATRRLLWISAAVLCIQLAGTLRLLATETGAGPRTLVAAVGTDFAYAGGALPTKEALDAVKQKLFERTRRAARAGAKLIVWNEASTMLWPAEEARFVEDLAGLARELGVELVAAYVVPLELEPLRYENKYVWVRPDGSVDHSYHKHRPVAGEPAAAGTGSMPVVKSELGRLSGAICYDYDYPELARGQAARDVGLVAVPSSDWRGIDPIHTEMAALRAIESGHSVLRSTRWGLSAGIDAQGRIQGRLSWFDTKDPVLLVHLPTRGVTTLYGVLGDWLVVVAAGVLLFSMARARRRQGATEKLQSLLTTADGV